MTKTPHEFESKIQTPLLLDYRLDYHKFPVGAWPGHRDSECLKIGPEWNRINHNRYPALTWIANTIQQPMLYWLNSSVRRDILPTGSFKLHRQRIWFRFDIIIGQTVIGEAWMPIFHISETKGTMLKIDSLTVRSEESMVKVYRCLQDYERQKTEYPVIYLLADKEICDRGKFVRIDSEGNLIRPVEFENIHSKGYVSDRITMNDRQWEKFDQHGNYEPFETRFA